MNQPFQQKVMRVLAEIAVHKFKTGPRDQGRVNPALTKLHQHCQQMRRNRSSAGPAVA